MECNRDEAHRAKEISEKKFEEKDYVGAKRFALKSKSLCPDIGGLEHFLTSLDVYISSEQKVNGVIDCYKVLNVKPNADEETIKKQYHKLALVVHPDKNKSLGAEGAFNIVKDAWDLLSDKATRSIHDKSINVSSCGSNSNCNAVSSSSKTGPSSKPVARKGKGAERKSRTPDANPASTGAPLPSQKNYKTSPTFWTGTSSKQVAQKGKGTERKSRTPDATPPTTGAPLPSQKNYKTSPTFWTVCHRCRMQHQYLRKYLNNNIICPICSVPFFAAKYPPPATQSPERPPSPQISEGPFNWQEFLKKCHESTTSSIGSGPSSQTTTQWSPLSPEALEKAKLDQEDKLKAMRRDREADLKKKSSSSKSEFGPVSDANDVKKRKVGDKPKGPRSHGSNIGISEPEKGAKNNRPKNSKDLPNWKISRKDLAQRARLEILNKVNEWKISRKVASAASKSKRMS